VIEEALECRNQPKCIFIPDRKLIRQMINAIVRRDTEESFDDFLLRLGLLDNPNQFFK
jgi:hypothetical protein